MKKGKTVSSRKDRVFMSLLAVILLAGLLAATPGGNAALAVDAPDTQPAAADVVPAADTPDAQPAAPDETPAADTPDPQPAAPDEVPAADTPDPQPAAPDETPAADTSDPQPAAQDEVPAADATDPLPVAPLALPVAPAFAGIMPLGGPLGTVITNDPAFDPNVPAATPGTMTWTAVQDHPGYDIAYTNSAGNINSYNSASPYSPMEIASYGYPTGTSGYYNGAPTPNHVVIKDGTVSLYGYGVQAYTDYIFTTAYHNNFYGISFDLTPLNMHFHSFHESVFLFNGAISGGKYTGYAIALVCGNTSGMQNTGTATLGLYYLNGVTLPTGNQQLDFTPANGATLITNFMTDISDLSSAPIQIKLTEDPVTKAFQIYVNGSQRINVANPLSGSTNDGFGFLTSYYSHNCPILTVMRFDNVQPDMKPVQTTCTVNFLEDGTNTVLQTPETETGWSGQGFTVTPPDIPGYVYSRSDRDLSNLTYDIDPGKNIINLYYMPFSAEKHASTLVNGVPTTNDGTPGKPVQVQVGDVIDYKIPVTGQLAPLPSAPIVFNPADLTASQNGYKSATSNGSGGAAAFTYPNSITGYPDGVNLAPAASPVCVQAIMRQGPGYTLNYYYQQYLWLTTKNALPAGSYKVTVTVAADARAWGDDAETTGVSGTTNVAAFMRGVVGGANGSFMATYNKAYGYSTFSDQLFPAATSPLPANPTITAPGRVTFRNGHTGYVTNAGTNFATTNNPYSVPSETTTFSSTLVLSDAQAAIVGLCLGGQLSGNDMTASGEHYTSMIRVFKVEFLPLAPPPNPVTVTDTLPAGLQYVANSQSVAGVASTFSQSGQTLTWNLADLPAGTTTVSFKATVTQRGVFENYAQAKLVANNGTVITNSTWHATDSYPVTEHYLDYNNQGVSLKPDKTTPVLNGGNYDVAFSSLADITSAGRTYAYYGYQYVDPADDPAASGKGAFHKGLPPSLDGSGAAATFVDIQSEKEINLFFVMNPQVTVQFYDVDNPATQLKTSVTDTAPYGIDYTLSAAYRGPIVNGGTTYNYYGYSIDGGATITQGPPPAPLYPALTADKTVKLYFKAAPAVIVHFVEYRHSLSILADDQTFLVPGAGSSFTMPENLMDDIDVTAIGKVYTYVGYTINSTTDSAAINTGAPPDPAVGSVPQSGAEITLYFRTTYDVTQVYHEDLPYSDTAGYVPLIPDVVQTFYGGDTTTGLGHPDPLYALGQQYNYVGYKWDNDGSTLIPAPAVPADFTIWADMTIVYWYQPQGPSTDYTVVTQYHRADNNMQLSPDVIETAPAGSNYTPPYQADITDADGVVWRYIGYQLDGGAMVPDTAPPTLANIDAAHVITLLYEIPPATPQKNAYINGSDTADNGEPGKPVEVYKGDKITYQILVDNRNAVVTDQIPVGLTLDETSISNGGTYDSGTHTITWDLSGQPAGAIMLEFTVTVSDPGEYDNTADVVYGDGTRDHSNTTQHYCKIYIVTERFLEFNNPSRVIDPSRDGNTVEVYDGGTYFPDPTPNATYTIGTDIYIYKGYTIDSDTTLYTGYPYAGTPPNPIDGPHTVTYWYQLPSALNAQKSASVNGGPSPGIWDPANPVPVKLGDTIQYSITLDNPGTPPESDAEPKYDVLFVVDYSGSMNQGYMMGTTGINALQYAKNITAEMAQYVLNNYPGSRVALLGMSSMQNCTNDVSKTVVSYLMPNGSTSQKADTQFVSNMTDYNSRINPLFSLLPQPSEDDNAQFLRLAVDKMAGLNTTYGTSNQPGYGQLIPRTDQSRVPVIIQISDFQATEAVDNTYKKYNNSGVGYWSNAMRAQSNRFASTFPKGVLLTVRLESSLTNAGLSGNYFASSTYDNLMRTYVAPSNYASRGWNFLPVPYKTAYTTFVANFKSMFNTSVPVPVPVYYPSTVTDVVPAGLTLAKDGAGNYIISGGGTYDPATRTITWDVTNNTDAQITLTFQTTVSEFGEFDNTANITYGVGIRDHTNTTYHYCAGYCKLTVTKKIGNFSSQSPAVQADLAARQFIIKLSGGMAGSTALSHGETSGIMSVDIPVAGAVVNISETVPMEFDPNYAVSFNVTHADGTAGPANAPAPGGAVTLMPGDTVAITVTNTYTPKPFFKAWDWAENRFAGA